MRHKWKIQTESTTISRNSIFANFLQACTNLDIQVHEDFKISFWGSSPFCFLDFHHRELKAVLALMCRHKCYHVATRGARKDTRPSEGIFDFHMTMQSQAHIAGISIDGLSLTCHHECILTGCTITRDRSFASGFSDTDQCRFCNSSKESMSHIVENCTSLPDALCKPQRVNSCGPNFDIFGLVEITPNEISCRLQISSLSEIEVEEWDDSATGKVTQLWTDGSLEYPLLYFQQRGGYAVVDCNGCVLKSGPVSHICMSSYTTELWALIVAFCGSHTDTHIHTDCKSLADQVSWMCLNEQVDFKWTHTSWWLFLLDVFRRRKQYSCSPLCISWCPAHQADDIPVEMLTPQVAKERGCNFLDLLCNRKADVAAKRAALKQCYPSRLENRLRMIKNWQTWLSKIHVEISKDSAERRNRNPRPIDGNSTYKILPSQISTTHAVDFFKHLLPKWAWEADQESFPWNSTCGIIPYPNSHASISQHDWDVIVAWLLNLKWREGPTLSTSWLELACQAWHDGVRLMNKHTPRVYMITIQKVINQTKKLDATLQLVPGNVEKKCKSNGKTHPIGRVSNAEAYICVKALKTMAAPMLHGADHRPSSWDFNFS